mmetsp:Transcript_25174/g.81337  ORF Transcript_25174/g.81337 Transcript_25174/m.81337 type:complete len:366 (-) Transcript_25174:102-1199(-)
MMMLRAPLPQIGPTHRTCPQRFFASEEAPEAASAAAPSRRRSSSLNPVKSLPSQSFAICQQQGFHQAVLRPFYSMQPVSNVVMGLVHGTSAYARTCSCSGLAQLLDVGGDHHGAFFMMPNPKYHWDPEELTKHQQRKWRFVAWWIAPMFLDELRSWFDDARNGASPSSSSEANGLAPPLSSSAANGLRGSPKAVGAPGDFGFSAIQKPPGYLHTYRDLSGAERCEMLKALVSSVRSFLEQLLGTALSSTPISAGFHYPVRPQYSTLHLQLRVNSGDVCGGEDRRGIDLMKVIASLSEDPGIFSRDAEVLHYQATDNLLATIMAAAALVEAPIHEVGPTSLVLRPPPCEPPPPAVQQVHAQSCSVA